MRVLRYKTIRRPVRFATRMLGGARRPRPTDWLGLACRALEEAIRIRQRLEPFFQEQQRQLDAWRWMQEWEPAIRKAFGPAASPSPISAPSMPVDPIQRRKELRALQRTDLLVARLKAKLSLKR
jgi:hypothetical protein